MTDAQTEARAIEVLSLETPAGNLIDAVRYEDHVAALAAKDAELVEMERQREVERISKEHARRECDRAEAQLAEARKALEQRDTDIIEFMGRLGSRWFFEQGWFPASADTREDDARRELEAQGGE